MIKLGNSIENRVRGKSAAHYEYAPFGALTKSTGPVSQRNPWRFSSEYADDVTGTVYYNYRHYEPTMGRWLSRDPIEEQGGVNLMAFCGNEGVFNIDILGMLYFHVFSYKKLGFWERLIKGAREEEVEVHSVNDIAVEKIDSDGVWGMFSHSRNEMDVTFRGRCEVVIDRLYIGLKNTLSKSLGQGQVLMYERHVGLSKGYSSVRGGSAAPVRGMIEAHEKGHAQAYLDVIVKTFKDYVVNLPNKPLTESTREQIRLEYKRIVAANRKQVWEAANIPTIQWLINSGYNFIVK